MFNTLKDLFDSLVAPAAGRAPGGDAHRLQLAVAVLLVEVMRADPAIDAAERKAVATALRDEFALADDELARLLELAETQAQSLYDYHHLTSVLNDQFSQPQKVAVVQAMWQVAYADARMDAHENHVISKVAGLLHVTHGEYIAAKMRAKESLT